ncbi:MAG: guanosine monophosphate reductase [Legionellales bacterium]|nr:guanosine monophosphate reductase [Legionellales bacterium]
MGAIKDSLTFDDVSLVPQHSSVLPSETKTFNKLCDRLNLQIPLMSSAMDTVTESRMAIAISKLGGIGVIHRNLSIEKQVMEIKKVKKNNYLVGAAIGVSPEDFERAEELFKVKTDLIVIDTAHGHTQKVLNMIRKIKKKLKNCTLCAGNIATGEAAKFLADSGVDIVKVGIGPGSICTTRVVSGVGVPQISAVAEVAQALQKKGIPLVADGGIRYSGDICKSIAAGASAIMIGGLFAGTEEAPGAVELYKGRTYKSYRGMGSLGAMSQTHGSSDRYFQESSEAEKLVPEGIEGRVPYKGSVLAIIYQLMGGLRSGMGYTGSSTIDIMRKEAQFVKITGAGMQESHAHDVTITKEAPNYPMNRD